MQSDAYPAKEKEGGGRGRLRRRRQTRGDRFFLPLRRRDRVSSPFVPFLSFFLPFVPAAVAAVAVVPSRWISPVPPRSFLRTLRTVSPSPPVDRLLGGRARVVLPSLPFLLPIYLAACVSHPLVV